MTWLAWRQHRASFLGAVGVLAVLAGWFLATGRTMRAEFTRLGLDACGVPAHLTCAEEVHSFTTQFGGNRFLLPLFLALPALVGVLWGAPLVSREVEQGTHRMIWTQSSSRGRWFATRVAVLAAAVAIMATALTWVIDWWLGPLMAAEPQQFDAGVFDLLGAVPATAALASLAIGIAAGTFTRRTMAAIAITLVAVVGLRIGIAAGLRPHYQEPIEASFAFPVGDEQRTADAIPQGWMIRQETVDNRGRVIGSGLGIDRPEVVDADCPELRAAERARSGDGVAPPDGTPGSDRNVSVRVGGAGKQAMRTCAERLGFHVEAVYQPADRFLRFQLTESAIYLALAAGLLALSAWWLRSRIS